MDRRVGVRFRLSDAHFELIKKISGSQERSESAIVREATEQYLERFAKENELCRFCGADVKPEKPIDFTPGGKVNAHGN